ncbi:MAG: AzlC family ABC transporter permease [Pseudomonadota bacterium]
MVDTRSKTGRAALQGAGEDPDGFVAGMRHGVRICAPGYLPSHVFGLAVGALAVAEGLSWLENALMSMFVAAGASQVVGLAIWDQPMPYLALVVATAIVNLRFLLMTATASYWMRNGGPAAIAGSALMTFDINWALAARAETRPGRFRWGMLIGGGIVIYVMWVSGAMLGHVLGGFVTDPRLLGVDVAVAAFFAAILVPDWKPSRRAVSWGVAVLVAVGVWWVFGGYWHIVTGALLGAIAGALHDGRRQAATDTMP